MAETVVFVDDEEKILKSVRRLFSDVDLDIECIFVDSASKALDIICKRNVAVLVSDNIMPGMMGVDFLAQVNKISPNTVKVMMTGRADTTSVVDAINRGGVFKFIMKPWENNELIRIVTEALLRHRTIQSLRKSDESTLLSLAQAIELKDRYTRGHCDRVARYALMMAKELNINEEIRKQIKYGCWLHDCGKIGVSEEILNKEGPLTEEEYAVIKNHPEWGADVARKAQLSQTVINIILYHHERFDSTGYPTGINGKNIPIEARIVSIADVFDAVTTDRSYRKKYDFNKAVEIILTMRGTSFDPDITDIFLSLVDTSFNSDDRKDFSYEG